MVLEDVDYKCLETWLYNKLKPLCVADPVPLSQYVIALIKKNKPEKELKDICIDQLEVFLQDNNISFVEDVFMALKNRSYLSQNSKIDDCSVPIDRNSSTSSASKDKRRNVSIEGPEGNGKQKKKKSPTRSKSRTCSRSRSRSPIVDLSRTTVTASYSMRTGNRNRDRGLHSETEGQKMPGDIIGGLHHERSDGNDDRRRRQRDLDLHRRDYPQSQSSRERSTQRARSRYDEPSRPKPYGTRNTSPRRNDRRCRAFEERGFCVYGDRCPYDHGPNALVIHNPTSVSTVLSQQRLSAPAVNLPDSSTGPASQSTGSCVGGIKTQLTTTNQSSNNDEVNTVAGQTSAATKLNSSEVVPVYRPTPIEHFSDIPVLPTSSINETAALQPNLLENTSIKHNLPHGMYQGPHNNRNHSSFIRRNVVPIPMVPSTDNSGSACTYTVLDSGVPNSAVSAPPAYEPDKPQMFMFTSEPSTVKPPTDPIVSELSSTHVYTPSPIANGKNTDVITHSTANTPLYQDAPFLLPIDDAQLQRFDNCNPPRGGFSRRRSTSVLYVTRLPRHLNNADKLFEHFRKFGNLSKIVNQLDGQPDAAMVEFSSPAEADAAYRSPEPLFSNRFIRLSLWSPNSQSTMRSGGFRPGGGFQKFGYNLRPRQSALSRIGRCAGGNTVSPWLNNSRLHSVLGDNQLELPAQHSNHGQETRRGGRSRWRLERTADGGGETMSGDEDEDTDEEALTSRQAQSGEDQAAADANDGTKSAHRDYSWMTLNKKRLRVMSASYGGGDCSTGPASKSRVGPYTKSKKETTDYLWQQLKAVALKQRQEKIMQLDKSLEARQSVIEALCKHIQQLTEKIKSMFDELERKSEGDGDRPVDRQALLTEVKQLQTELKAAVDRRNGLLLHNRDGKAQRTSADLDTMPISVAALQVLPEPVANERRKQIVEVKSQLLEVQTEASILKVKGEPVVEQNRRILELKRKLVDLETVRPTDINMNFSGATGLDQNDPSRIQTKLDKRPRTVFITGLCVEHTEDFLRALTVNYLHFQNSVKRDNPAITGDNFYLEVTFRTRDFAEAAMHQFRRFRGNPLHMSFEPPQLTETCNIDKEVCGKMEADHVEGMSRRMGCDESTAASIVSSTQIDPPEPNEPLLNLQAAVPTSSTNM